MCPAVTPSRPGYPAGDAADGGGEAGPHAAAAAPAGDAAPGGGAPPPPPLRGAPLRRPRRARPHAGTLNRRNEQGIYQGIYQGIHQIAGKSREYTWYIYLAGNIPGREYTWYIYLAGNIPIRPMIILLHFTGPSVPVTASVRASHRSGRLYT